jgi:hypothetical protein
LGNVFPKLIHVSGLLRFLLYPAVILTLLASFSFIYSSITNSLDIKTKFKNALAMFIYALMPHIFALVLFTCIELALFGIYLFYFNPDPFFIKPVPAYILAGLEFIFIIWSSILAFMASYTYTKGKLYSVITALIYTLLIWGVHFII